MPKRIIAPGSVGVTDDIFVRDASVTTRVAGLAGLDHSTPGLTLYYYRAGAGAPVAVPLQSAVLGTWTDGGIVAVDAVHMPGRYQIGYPDAAFVIGAPTVGFQLRGAPNMEEVPWQYEIDASALYGESGATTYEFISYDVDGTTPLQGVAVFVSSDLNGVYKSQVKLSDALGRTFFQLSPGPIYVWQSRIDRRFTNPISEVVT